jgi:glycosyltransferase involved in cell wall biosynthesis
MATPLRVLLVMPLAEQRGGAEKMLQHLLVHTPQVQVTWCVAFLEDGPMVQWVLERQIKAVVIPAGRMRSPGQFLGAVRLFVHLIKGWGPDVVFSWMTKGHLYAGIAAKFARVPAAWYNHTITDGGWLDRVTTLVPARWVAVPSKVAQGPQSRLLGSPACHVIYPGIDLAEFDREALPPAAEVRAEFNIPQGRLLVGTVARLQRWKGVHVFLQAAARVARVNPAIHVMVVGGAHFSEPEYPAELERLAESLGISDRVTFTGQRADVARLMNAFDLFVHASARPEPGGMTNMEAMALGKPVIATRAGGPTETVVDGVTGLLVAPDDVEAMADALTRLIADPALGRRFEQAAMERVQLHFAAEIMSRRVVSLLEHAVLLNGGDVR